MKKIFTLPVCLTFVLVVSLMSCRKEKTDMYDYSPTRIKTEVKDKNGNPIKGIAVDAVQLIEGRRVGNNRTDWRDEAIIFNRVYTDQNGSAEAYGKALNADALVFKIYFTDIDEDLNGAFVRDSLTVKLTDEEYSERVFGGYQRVSSKTVSITLKEVVEK